MTDLKTMTLAQLREEVAFYSDLPGDTLVTFGEGDLSFNRIEPRLFSDDNRVPILLSVEFNEVYKVTHS